MNCDLHSANTLDTRLGKQVTANVQPRIYLPFRQLEAIIRISESLAKMRLLPFATAAHVEEALRLFQVSTLDAAMSGSLSGELMVPTLCICNKGV